MRLSAGAALGPYRIESLLGSGGMGEVYRAIDSRLDRPVAIKVLPIAEQSVRRERFEREARLIATLSHPHICTLYDVGDQHGTPYLVMEYLEGNTLASRLAHGPLPIAEALRYGAQIASALDHAHRRGIVHRDLKPANVMLTAGGIKLLDFGVAALRAPDSAEAIAGASLLPTLTDSQAIVGTTPYMAPEQLEGRRPDPRVDLFALGVVLYEMITSERPFDGPSPAHVVAAILDRDPPSVSAARSRRVGSAGPSSVPPLVDDVVMRCLAKNPNERWQSAADLEPAIQWAAATLPLSAQSGRSNASWLSRPMRRLAGVAALILVVVAVLFALRGRPQADNPQAVTFTIAPPEGTSFNPSSAFMALSPDGRLLAFTGASADRGVSLWLRPLDQAAARPLPGTEGGIQPFWSPDSRTVAFFSAGALKQVTVATEAVITLAAEGMGTTGTWNRDGVILFTRSAEQSLYRLPAGAGRVVDVTSPRSRDVIRRWPAFLPDGRHFLYLAQIDRSPVDQNTVTVGALDSDTTTPLFASTSHAVYVPQGYLLFMQGGTLVAQAFDSRALRLSGDPIPLVEDVEYNPASHRGAFSVSETGVLAYRRVGPTRLVWVDRTGRHMGTLGAIGYYANPQLSPDERTVAVTRFDSSRRTQDIWTFDVSSGMSARVTVDGHVDKPVWSNDGRRLMYKTATAIVDLAIGSTGKEHVFLEDRRALTPLTLTPDGRGLLYEEGDPHSGNSHISLLPLAASADPHAILQTPFTTAQGQISPDGRYLAYASNETGRFEVYVRRFPAGDERWQISTSGGLEPQWRRDGHELLFLAGDRTLMSIPVEAGKTFSIGQARPLFETRLSTNWNGAYTRNQYVVSHDGQRFLLNEPTGDPSPITVVLNWTMLLEAPRPAR